MDNVKITILAEGTPGSGKTKAITLMLNVFKDNPHFLNAIVNKSQLDAGRLEVVVFDVQLRRV